MKDIKAYWKKYDGKKEIVLIKSIDEKGFYTCAPKGGGLVILSGDRLDSLKTEYNKRRNKEDSLIRRIINNIEKIDSVTGDKFHKYERYWYTDSWTYHCNHSDLAYRIDKIFKELYSLYDNEIEFYLYGIGDIGAVYCYTFEEFKTDVKDYLFSRFYDGRLNEELTKIYKPSEGL